MAAWIAIAIGVALLAAFGLWSYARPHDDAGAASSEEDAGPTGPIGETIAGDDATDERDAGPAPERTATSGTPVRLSPAVLRADPSCEAGTLAGTVVGYASAAPIAGAELTFSSGETTVSATSGEDGAFRFAAPTSGTYVLALAMAEDYLPFAPAWGQSPIRFDARAGVCVEGVRVILTDAIPLTVRVEDAHGEPVRGATVRVFGADRGELTLAPIDDAYRTDADGEVAVIAPDFAILEAAHPERGVGRASVDTGAQVSHAVTIRLSAEAPPDRRAEDVLRGTVTGPDGAAVAGARIEASAGDPRGDELHPGLHGTSADDGTFALTGADRTTYRVVASAEGFARARVDGATVEAPIAIQLGREGRVQVRVVDAERPAEPIAAWTVIVERSRGALESDALTMESGYGDGTVRIGGLPEGPVRLVAVSPGYAPSDPIDAVASAAPRTVELALTRGATIRGRVVSAGDGARLVHARASVEGRLGDGPSPTPVESSALSDDEGVFVLGGVPRGVVSVAVFAEGHHGRIRSGIVVGDEPVDVGTIDLSVVEPGDTPGIELAGIGAILAAEGDVLMVRGVVDGGGAQQAGLHEGDAILSIDGAPVGPLGFGGCIERIRGPEGTVVMLEVRRAGTERSSLVPVLRRRIRA